MRRAFEPSCGTRTRNHQGTPRPRSPATWNVTTPCQALDKQATSSRAGRGARRTPHDEIGPGAAFGHIPPQHYQPVERYVPRQKPPMDGSLGQLPEGIARMPASPAKPRARRFTLTTVWRLSPASTGGTLPFADSVAPTAVDAALTSIPATNNIRLSAQSLSHDVSGVLHGGGRGLVRCEAALTSIPATNNTALPRLFLKQGGAGGFYYPHGACGHYRR